MKSKPRIPPIITPIAESDRNANSIWYRFFDSLLEYIVNGFPDAPDDGNQYGRQSLQWTVINPWVDAPADNLYYGRVNLQWGAVVEEAPINGVTYVRENGAWIPADFLVRPALPFQSVQFNESGVFGGSEEFLFDEPNRILYLGYDNPSSTFLATGWTIKPRVQASATRDGNYLRIYGGEPNGARIGGNVTVATASGTFQSGNLDLQTGSTSSGTYNTGQINIATGSASGGASVSGQMFISTGSAPGSSGGMTIGTGSAQGSGQVTIVTGTASSTFASGRASLGTGFKSSGSFGGSGPLDLFTGDVPDGTNTSGDVNIVTGDCLGNSSSGDITIAPGSVVTGTPGNILADRFALPHRVGAPASIIDGMLWTTTAGLFARISGTTVGPFAGAGAGTPGGASGTVQYNNAGAFGGITNLTTDGTNVTAATIAGTLTVTTAKATFAATAAGYASINLPHGTAPSAPTNGDVWTTTAGMYARINGTTVGPFGTGGGTPGGSNTQVQFNDSGAFGGATNMTWVKATNALTVTGPTTLQNVDTSYAAKIGSATTGAGVWFRTEAAGAVRRVCVDFSNDGTLTQSNVMVFRDFKVGLGLDPTSRSERFQVSGDGYMSGTATLGGAAIAGTLTVTTAKATFAATAAAYASINLPHGTAPSTPTNGDAWTTTAGMYVRINGATVGPLGTGGGSPGGSSTQLQYNNAGAFGGISSATSDGTSIIFGTGARIKGDFSASVLTDRSAFQSSTVNGYTALTVIPNGTSRIVALNMLNAASPTANEPYFSFYFDNTISSIDSLRTGSASALPLQIRVGNSPTVTAYFATNFNINFGSTASDPGYKVQVEGTFNVTGVARFASTSTFIGATTHQALATFTGAISGANGQIFLNNGTSNWINWAALGAAAPAFTTRSAGVKLLLWPAISGSAADYAIGIEGSTIWFGLPSTTEKFKWYGGTTNIAWMSGTGNLSLGVGAAPSAWGTTLRAVENGRVGNALYGGTSLGQTGICCNYYFDGTNLKYANTGALGIFELLDDALTYSNAASGTGGTTATIAQRFQITANGNIVPGNAALATSATDGFLYLPTCAGAPSGTPTAYTGRVAQVYDTTNNRLYVYNGGWKSVVLA